MAKFTVIASGVAGVSHFNSKTEAEKFREILSDLGYARAEVIPLGLEKDEDEEKDTPVVVKLKNVKTDGGEITVKPREIPEVPEGGKVEKESAGKAETYSIPTGNAQLIFGLRGEEGEEFTATGKELRLPPGRYMVVGKDADMEHSGPWGMFSFLSVKKIGAQVPVVVELENVDTGGGDLAVKPREMPEGGVVITRPQDKDDTKKEQKSEDKENKGEQKAEVKEDKKEKKADKYVAKTCPCGCPSISSPSTNMCAHCLMGKPCPKKEKKAAGGYGWYCQECGHKFPSAASAEKASYSDSGCPGCGGSDIDESLPVKKADFSQVEVENGVQTGEVDGKVKAFDRVRRNSTGDTGTVLKVNDMKPGDIDVLVMWDRPHSGYDIFETDIGDITKVEGEEPSPEVLEKAKGELEKFDKEKEQYEEKFKKDIKSDPAEHEEHDKDREQLKKKEALAALKVLGIDAGDAPDYRQGHLVDEVDIDKFHFELREFEEGEFGGETNPVFWVYVWFGRTLEEEEARPSGREDPIDWLNLGTDSTVVHNWKEKANLKKWANDLYIEIAGIDPVYGCFEPMDEGSIRVLASQILFNQLDIDNRIVEFSGPLAEKWARLNHVNLGFDYYKFDNRILAWGIDSNYSPDVLAQETCPDGMWALVPGEWGQKECRAILDFATKEARVEFERRAGVRAKLASEWNKFAAKGKEVNQDDKKTGEDLESIQREKVDMKRKSEPKEAAYDMNVEQKVCPSCGSSSVDLVNTVNGEDVWGCECGHIWETKAGNKKVAVITQGPDGWHVKSEEGKNLGGPYGSKEEAEKRLKQVEYFKHKGSKVAVKYEGPSDETVITTAHITAQNAVGEDLLIPKGTTIKLTGLYPDFYEGIYLGKMIYIEPEQLDPNSKLVEPEITGLASKVAEKKETGETLERHDSVNLTKKKVAQKSKDDGETLERHDTVNLEKK